MKQSLGEYIQNARMAVGLTQKALAAKLGYTTPQFISNFERGYSLPAPAKLAFMAKLLKVNEENLKVLYYTEAVELYKSKMQDRLGL